MVYATHQNIMVRSLAKSAAPMLVGTVGARTFGGPIACSPDGDTIAAGVVVPLRGSECVYDIGLWSMHASSVEGRLTEGLCRVDSVEVGKYLQAFRFSPNGRFLAAAVGIRDAPYGPRAKLQLFEVVKESGCPRWRDSKGTVLTELPARASSLDWSADGQTVAVGCANGTVHCMKVT